MSPTMMKIAS